MSAFHPKRTLGRGLSYRERPLLSCSNAHAALGPSVHVPCPGEGAKVTQKAPLSVTFATL